MSTHENHFKKYYESIPERARVEIRDKFLQESGLPFATFYQKLGGRLPWKKLERKCMSEITGYPAETLFEGKVIESENAIQ